MQVSNNTSLSFNLFNELPKDIIRTIFLINSIKDKEINFTNLTYLTRVCKKFYHIIYNDLFPKIFLNYSHLRQAIDLRASFMALKILEKCPHIDPTGENNFIIGYASSSGFTEIVQALLKDPRVDPAAQSNYAIRFASFYGRIEVVKILLKDPRVNPADQQNHALRWAQSQGHQKVAEILLKDPRVMEANLNLPKRRVTIHRSNILQTYRNTYPSSEN